MNRFFAFAGMTFEVRSDFTIGNNTFHPRLKLFEVSGPRKDNIVVRHCFHIPDDIRALRSEDAFSSQPLWTVFKLKDRWIFKKYPALPVSEKDTVYFEFKNHFTLCNVYSDFLTQKAYESGKYVSLTLFGCDQLLIARLLTDRKGFVMHANGFVQDKKGRLLVGTSGSGKSTLSRMMTEQGIHIAGDDKMVVTLEGGKAVMHGSWLHGTTPTVSKGDNDLDSIFLLEQSTKNQITPIKDKSKILAVILQAIVRPYISAQHWQILLGNAEKLANRVSFYNLKFDLSGDIVHLLDGYEPKQEK